MIGGELSTNPNFDISTVEKLEGRSIRNYIYRPIIIKTYIGLQIIVFLAASIFLMIKKRPFPKLMFIIKKLMPVIASVPLALLIISPLYTSTINMLFFYLLLVIMIIVVLAYIFSRKNPFLAISTATFLLLISDIIVSSQLMKISLFGYCPIIGGRFYGIGNEYMGVLIGSLITSSTLFLDKYNARDNKAPLILSAITYILTIYIMASPSLGANVGGTITAVITLFIVFLKFFGRKITIKEMAYGALLTACVILILATFDITRVENVQSHVGKTIELIRNNGVLVIKDTIFRKLATNIRVFRYTIWTRILVVFLITFAIIFYKPGGYLKYLFKKNPYTVIGWSGCLIASFVALAFNDSGVAPSASCLIFPGTLAVYMMLDEKLK